MRSSRHNNKTRVQRFKGTLLSTLLCLVGVGCTAPGGNLVVSKNSAPLPAPTSDEPATEIREDKYPDGKVQRRMEGYRNEDGELVAHGETRTYFKSGEKQSLVTYVSGVRHGPRIAWYRNGVLRSKGQFVDGKEHGTWIVWYPNKVKAEERHYEHGAYNGLFIVWHMNGQKKSEGNWTMGRRQGPHTVYDETGRLVQRIEFVDDVPQP